MINITGGNFDSTANFSEANSDLFFEMANVHRTDTGLPHDIWIDSLGKDRNVPHNRPRIKVRVGQDLIPISIPTDAETTPEILVDKTVPNFKVISDYIIKHRTTLLRHWNHEITDRQALNLLGTR